MSLSSSSDNLSRTATSIHTYAPHTHLYHVLFSSNTQLYHAASCISPKANSALHPSGVGKWVPASAGNAKAGMVHSVSGWMRAGCADPLRTRAIPERLRGVFTTRHYTYPRLPLPLPYIESNKTRHANHLQVNEIVSIMRHADRSFSPAEPQLWNCLPVPLPNDSINLPLRIKYLNIFLE